MNDTGDTVTVEFISDATSHAADEDPVSHMVDEAGPTAGEDVCASNGDTEM